MHMMIRVTIDVVSGNEAIRSGKLGKVMGDFAAKFKPEAMYFTTDNGVRTAYIVFDMKDVTDMPAIAEPFFMDLNADIDYLPVMNKDELTAGLGKYMQGAAH